MAMTSKWRLIAGIVAIMILGGVLVWKNSHHSPVSGKGSGVTSLRPVTPGQSIVRSEAPKEPAQEAAATQANSSSTPSASPTRDSVHAHKNNQRIKQEDNKEIIDSKNANEAPPRLLPEQNQQAVLSSIPTPGPIYPKQSAGAIILPPGTQLNIRIVNELNSEKAKAGDVFHGSISTPVVLNGQIIIPTTADVEGRIVEVKSAEHTGQSGLALELTALLLKGKRYHLVTENWSKTAGSTSTTKIGGGAAVGAVIGSLAGGGKGAAIGAATGSSSGISARQKRDQIVLRPEAILTFKLRDPLVLRSPTKTETTDH